MRCVSTVIRPVTFSLRRVGNSRGRNPVVEASVDGGKPRAGEQDFSDFFESLFGRRGGRQTSAQGFSLRGSDIHYVMPVTLEESYAGGTRTIALEAREPLPDGRMAPRVSNISVTIPRGVVNGQHLRLRGKGGPGHGDGEPGDLFLEIELQPHSRYTVEGRDLTMALPVAPWELALGESVDVPTLGGKVKLTIPANGRSGQKLRLKGRGAAGHASR